MGFKYGNLEGTRKSFHIGTGPDEASAQLQADSTTRGFLMPRMTSAQRIAISTPAEGLQVFDTDIKRIFLYANGSWTREEAESIETDLTMYVDGTTGNDSNDGLTWGTAKKTFGFLMMGETDSIPRCINADLTVNWRNTVRARNANGLLVVNNFYGSGSITISGALTAVETFTATGYENDETVRGSLQWVSDATKAWTPNQWRRHFVDLGHTWRYPIRKNDATTLWMGFGDDQAGSYASTIYAAPELLRELDSNPGVKYDFDYDNFVYVTNCSIPVTIIGMWLDENVTYAPRYEYNLKIYLQYVATPSPTISGMQLCDISQCYINHINYGITAIYNGTSLAQNTVFDSTDSLGYGIYIGEQCDFMLIESWVGNQLWGIDIVTTGTFNFNRSNYIQDCGIGVAIEGGKIHFMTPVPPPLQLRFDNVDQAFIGMGDIVRITEFEIRGWDVTQEFVFSDTDTGSFADFTAATLQSRQQLRLYYSAADYTPILLDEYDNTTSGLLATRYQTAIDELAASQAAEAIIAPLTMYVDGTIGNDANDGLTWGTAKQTCGFLDEGESDALPREINAAVVINVRGPLRARSATVMPLRLLGFYGSGSITVRGEMTAEETFTASTYDNDITVQGSLQWMADGTKAWTPGEWRRHFVDIGASDMYPIRSNTDTTLYLSSIRAIAGTPAGTIYSVPEVLSELVTNPGVKYDFDTATALPVTVAYCSINIGLTQLWFDEYFGINASPYVAFNNNTVQLYRVALAAFMAQNSEYLVIDVAYSNLSNYSYWIINGTLSTIQYCAIDSSDATGYGIYFTQPSYITMYRTWIGNQTTALWVGVYVHLHLEDNIYIESCTDGILLFGGCAYGEVVVTGYIARFDTVTRGIVGNGDIIKLNSLIMLGWGVTDEIVFSDTDSGTFAELIANTLQSRSGLNILTYDADYRPVLLDEYDNTTSGLTATRYQTAIDELAADIANGTNYAQEVTVALTGGQYTLPSAAVASILDATASKRYVVHIYPGEYADNVVMKDYVDLIGIGPPRAVVIKSSSGTVITMGNSARSDLRNLTISRTSTTNDEHAIEISAGTHLIYDCVITQTSTGAFGCLVDVTGTGVVQFNTGQLSLVQSGAASGAGNTNTLVHTTGATELSLRGINAYLEVGDTADRAVAFFEESSATGLIAWQDCFIDVNINVAAYASVASAMELRTGTTNKNLTATRVRVRNSVSAAGTGQAFILASPAGGAYMKSVHNLVDVTGFALNYLGSVATGDLLVTEFDSVVAPNGSIGAGTISNEDGTQLYHGVYARSTVAGLNCLPTHITTTTFTLGATANPIRYFYKGINVVVSADKTATLDDGLGGTSAGLYYVYFSKASGTILATKTHPGFTSLSDIIIAMVYWNGSNYGLVTDERHGYTRSMAWHAWAHNTIGPRYRSGFDFVPTGTGASATFTMSNGELWDEDVVFSAVGSANYPTPHTLRTWYQTGASTYTFDNVTPTTPFRAGAAGRPNYVKLTGYVLTEASSAPNRYFNFFIYGVADMHTPIYCFVETVPDAIAADNGYASATLARAVPFPSLPAFGLSPELRPLYRLVVRADGAVQALITVDDYRSVTSVPVSGGAGSVNASAVTFTPAGTIVSSNVQLAIEELDTEIYAALGTLDSAVDTSWVDERRYGLVDPDNTTTLAFNPATYQLTLGSVNPTWAYWRNGVRHTITGAKVATLAGTPPTAGTYYIYIDATDGTLAASSVTPWTLADTKVPVAIVAWDDAATPKHLLADERHSCEIHRAYHREHHFADGAELVTGGTVADYVVNESAPAGDDDNTFSIAETVFYDEDRTVTCAALTDPTGAGGDCMTMTRTGASTYGWAWSDVPFVYTPAGYINWNNGGTSTEGQSGKFYCTYLFATNFAGDGRFVNLMGRGEYATLSEAEGENLGLFDLTGFPSAESIALYRFVWATDSTYTTKGKVRMAVEPVGIMESFVALQNKALSRPVRVLDDLKDVTITTPAVDQVIRYNGLQWVNGAPSAGAGAGPGAEFYFDNTSVIAAGAENTFALETLAATPSTDVEGTETVTVNASTAVCKAYVTAAALGRTSIDGGAYTYHVWAGVSTTASVSTLQVSFHRVIPNAVYTATITGGPGTSRTCTISGGSHFVAGDANASLVLAGYVQTPKGLYQITGHTSATVVTIAVPAAYVNESAVAWSQWRYIGNIATTDINTTTPTYTAFELPTIFASVACNTTDKFGAIVTGTTTRIGSTVITWTREGSTRYSHVTSPMGATHEQLQGLIGGAANDHAHMTTAQTTTLGGLTTVVQGDLPYASAANTWSLLAKSSTAGHILTNSGSSNNPAWAAPAVPTLITVADTADTTCFVALFEDATGNLGPKTDAALLYNANTGALSSTLFTANTITANTGVVPDANDGAYLGTTALGWSDLFLAEGGVINWDNGDITLTQTNDLLALAGGYFLIGTTAGINIGGTVYTYPLMAAGSDSGSNIHGFVLEGSAIHSRFQCARHNGTLSGKTIIGDADGIAAWNALGWDGGITPTYVVAASITMSVDGTVAEDSVPGKIVFWTRPIGGGSTIERLRIDQDGSVVASLGIVPDANDGAYLGTTALGWSDLFLASGGVINWANGNYTLTHATGTLQTSGSFGIGTAPSYRLHVVSATSSAAWMTSADTAITVGTAGGTLTLQNSNATTDNLTTIVFRDAAGATGGIYMQNTDQTNHYGRLNFVARGADGWLTRMQIESDGKVGIGGTPQATLDVQAATAWIRAMGATSPYISAQDTTNSCVVKIQALDTFAYVGTQSDHEVRFIVNNSAKAYLTTTGRLGISVAAPSYILHTSVNGRGDVGFDSHSASDDGVFLWLRRSGGTQASPAVVPAGHRLGNISFAGYYSASQSTYGAVIQSIAIGEWSSSNYGACIQFFTTTTNTISIIERMRISDAGKIGVANVNPSALLTLGLAGTTAGTLSLAGATIGTLTVDVPASVTSWTMTMPSAVPAGNGYALVSDTNGDCSWSANIAGNAATVTVANEASDTTCFPTFVTAVTGSLEPKTNASFKFNASTAYMDITGITISGNGSGTTAQVVNVLYGTGDPPSTSGIPYGTLYVKHEA